MKHFWIIPLFTVLHSLHATTIFDELSRHGEVLDVRLEANFGQIFSDLGNDDKHPALMVWTDADGRHHEELLKVKLRGKFRRQTCDFKPLMLKFKKDHLARRGLSDHNDLKLVTHCTDGDRLTSKYTVLREYLAYKMYAHLTPLSYRVQLVRITYVDGETHDRTRRWGILIEDTDEMAERLGGEELEDVRNLPVGSVHQSQEHLMAAFQLLIGNQDYSIPNVRNLKYVLPTNGGVAIPVPYDFDFSGMVAANYAVPNPNFPVLTVQDRIFLGRPEDAAGVERMCRHLHRERGNLYRLVLEFDLLPEDERASVLRYLDGFYEIKNFDDLLRGKVAYYYHSIPVGMETHRAVTE